MDNQFKIPTFIKWAGGKRRLIPNLEPLLPKNINRYFEPFLGGGSMFFYIKQVYNPKYCLISDVNHDLISSFIAVRDKPKKLISSIEYFKSNYSEDFYYKTRERFNKNKFLGIKRCAAFIFLNKTCFNGLYRVNSKNQFNVPFGKYDLPKIYNKENILFASQLLQGTIIKLMDYRKLQDIVKKDDFIYMDPCYDPIKKTSFANYTPRRFCTIDRIELAKFIRFITNKGAKVILSNNDLPEIRKIYSDFKITEIFAKRCINSDPFGRGDIIELAIGN